VAAAGEEDDGGKRGRQGPGEKIEEGRGKTRRGGGRFRGNCEEGAGERDRLVVAR